MPASFCERIRRPKPCLSVIAARAREYCVNPLPPSRPIRAQRAATTGSVGRRERDLVEHDEPQRPAGHVDALPEAHRGDEHRVARCTETDEQHVLRRLALHHERPAPTREPRSARAARASPGVDVHSTNAPPPVISTSSASASAAASSNPGSLGSGRSSGRYSAARDAKSNGEARAARRRRGGRAEARLARSGSAPPVRERRARARRRSARGRRGARAASRPTSTGLAPSDTLRERTSTQRTTSPTSPSSSTRVPRRMSRSASRSSARAVRRRSCSASSRPARERDGLERLEPQVERLRAPRARRGRRRPRRARACRRSVRPAAPAPRRRRAREERLRRLARLLQRAAHRPAPERLERVGPREGRARRRAAATSTLALDTRVPKKSVAMSSIWCASSKMTASYAGMTLACAPRGPVRSARSARKRWWFDDDDLRVLGLAPHARDEAALEVLAPGADARLARRRHVAPRARVLGQVDELGAVAASRSRAPTPRCGRTRGRRRARRSARASSKRRRQRVVREPLHQRGAHGHAVGLEGLRHERQVLDEDLLLQRLRRGRDDDLPAAEHRRDEVRERLARPRPRLDEQVLLLLQRDLDRLGHRELPVAVLPARQRPWSGDPGPRTCFVWIRASTMADGSSP